MRIRERMLAHGRKSLYLDIYIKGERRYENLHLILERETDQTTKNYNKTIWKEAAERRAQKEAEVYKDRIIVRTTKENMLLTDLLEEFKEYKMQTGHSESVIRNIDNTILHIRQYHKEDIKLRSVSKSFLAGWIDYLGNKALEQRHGGLKNIRKTTAKLYLGVLSGSLKMALRKKYLTWNPMNEIVREDRISLKASGKERSYLTVEELTQMMNTPIRNIVVKQAFLFGCFTGLRISDISSLRWDNIKKLGENRYLTVEMRKTRKMLTIKLNKNAERWLPEQNGNERVFLLPRHLGGVNGCIKSWAKKAGIDKDISFHTSRHTFATLELTYGASLYVVSKLLGHASISTTQIYADIIDKKRDEALDLLDSVFD